MSRALPNCALCGTPLSKAAGRCILKWDALPGRPSIGWCDACGWGPKDPEFLRLKPDEALPAVESLVEPVLAAIEARGPGRVTWSKKP